MHAIVDVYNRGGASSLGIIVKTSARRFSLKHIAEVAQRRAGGANSGAYIPCIGVKLTKPVPQGWVISEGVVSDIYGTAASLRSIQEPSRTITKFDLDALIAAAEQSS